MAELNYSYLLLRTAFSFMTCDGHIDRNEVMAIREMDKTKRLFGDVEVTDELELMLERINLKGIDFLKEYFRKVDKANLSTEQELEILQVAVDIIYADEFVKDEEVKFLRVLRTILKVTDEEIIKRFPQLAKEFMWEDEFTEEYIKILYSNYFKNQSLPVFDISDVREITDKLDRED